MKATLKREVLLPLLVMHIGIITLVWMVILMVPYSMTAAYLLIGAGACTIGGTIVLWRFVVNELHSIQRCREALENGGADQWHVDRSDELGELEQSMIAHAHK